MFTLTNRFSSPKLTAVRFSSPCKRHELPVGYGKRALKEPSTVDMVNISIQKANRIKTAILILEILEKLPWLAWSAHNLSWYHVFKALSRVGVQVKNRRIIANWWSAIFVLFCQVLLHIVVQDTFPSWVKITNGNNTLLSHSFILYET